MELYTKHQVKITNKTKKAQSLSSLILKNEHSQNTVVH